LASIQNLGFTTWSSSNAADSTRCIGKTAHQDLAWMIATSAANLFNLSLGNNEPLLIHTTGRDAIDFLQIWLSI